MRINLHWGVPKYSMAISGATGTIIDGSYLPPKGWCHYEISSLYGIEIVASTGTGVFIGLQGYRNPSQKLPSIKGHNS